MSDLQARFESFGREFLTWLLYQAERGSGRIELDGVGPVGVAFARRLVLDAGGVAPDHATISADAPGDAEEARTSLRLGKQVASARLLIEVGERAFELSLQASTFVFTGVKLPTVTETGEHERLAERLLLLEELEAIIDGFYVQFARLRLDDAAWAEVRQAMHRWATRAQDA